MHWQCQNRKDRLFKMTETQVRLQMCVATYISSGLVRYQTEEKKTEQREVKSTKKDRISKRRR